MVNKVEKMLNDVGYEKKKLKSKPEILSVLQESRNPKYVVEKKVKVPKTKKDVGCNKW